MKFMIKKQGITLTIMTITVILLVIIASTITISVYSTINYSTLSTWANELMYIQDIVDEQLNLSSDTSFTSEEIVINDLNTDIIQEQFAGETISADNSITLKVLDLGKLDITNIKYGNLNNPKDVYAMSEATGIVYYVQGLEVSDKTYYTLTDSLKNRFGLNASQGKLTSVVFVPSVIGYSNKPITVTVKVPNTYTNIVITTSNAEIQIGSQTVKENTYEYKVNTNNIAGNYTVTVSYNDGVKTLTSEYKVNGYDITAPTIDEITTTNYVYKETQNSVIDYVTGVTATDASGISKIKYEVGIIEEKNAKEYFVKNGKHVVGERINLSGAGTYYTIYAEDNAGNFSLFLLDVSEQAYAIYSEKTQSLIFVKTDKKLAKGGVYNGIEITELYTGFEGVQYASAAAIPWYENRTNITSVTMQDTISPISTYYWFTNFTKCSTFDLVKLNTSATKGTSYMFDGAGSDVSVTKFEIIGADNWDMSKVTSAWSMFRYSGQNATDWNIGDLSNWNVSKLLKVGQMFYGAGQNAEEFNIGDIGKWNVSKLTTMYHMFSQAAKYSKKVYIGNLDNWDTSNVGDMSAVFYCFAENASEFSIGDLSNWNTSKATIMESMFYSAGENAETFNPGDLSTKEVTRSDGTKYIAWDVSNVEKMRAMFALSGQFAANWNIGDISNWNTSKVTDMSYMFKRVAANEKITTFSIGDISKWDTANVTDMAHMFYLTAAYADWSLDLSKWDVGKVTSYDAFKFSIESKIISPKFKVQETTPTT